VPEYRGFSGGEVSNLDVAASALRIATQELGISLNEEQFRILLGHASFESGFGMSGAKNTLRNTNNWGAIQATKSFVDAHAGEPGYGAIAHQDSQPGGKTFIGWYVVNPSAVAGAKQFLSRVKGAINGTTDVNEYAARLYQGFYYGGVHRNSDNDPRGSKRTRPFLPAEQLNVNDYANAIRRSMPRSVPQDSKESEDAAKSSKTGPFAPLADRLTAADKAAGRLHGDASDAAEKAWNASSGSSKAYGIDSPGSYDELASSNGVAWLGQGGGSKSNETASPAVSGFLAKIENLLNKFMAEAKAEQFLIIVNSDFDLSSKIEYASILKTAIEEELRVSSDVFVGDSGVEVECAIRADKEKALAAIKELCFAISDTFEYATRKIGGVKIHTLVITDCKSNYQELDINLAEINHRKFLYKFAKVGK
jgi:hypothetical protein